MTNLHHPKKLQVCWRGPRRMEKCSTMYKLDASCLVAWITDWSVNGRAISSIQNGIMSCEDCYKYNFILQSGPAIYIRFPIVSLTSEH